MLGLVGFKDKEVIMQKVFINKDTNMVEQILKEEGEEIKEDYFSSCYMVEDLEEKIKDYNLRYNKATQEFEVVEGIPARDEVIVIKQPTAEEIQDIKKENEDLKSRLEKIENMLSQINLNNI